MTTMKDVIKLLDADASSVEILARCEREIPGIMEYISDASDQAQSVILNKISEKDFVKLARVVSGLAISSLMTEGEGGIGLMFEHAQGNLDGFVHTVTLGILGVLISEEVI